MRIIHRRTELAHTMFKLLRNLSLLVIAISISVAVYVIRSEFLQQDQTVAQAMNRTAVKGQSEKNSTHYSSAPSATSSLPINRSAEAAITNSTPQANDIQKAKDDAKDFIVIDKNTISNLSESPGGASSPTPIPSGTKLLIIEKRLHRNGPIQQEWYKVAFEGETGWISQYDTTGEITSESPAGTSKHPSGAPLYATPKFSKEAMKDWMDAEIRTGTVTSISYSFGEKESTKIVLPSEKYLGDAYKNSAGRVAHDFYVYTGYKESVLIDVMDPNGQKVLWWDFFLPN